MEVVTRKPEIQTYLRVCLKAYELEGLPGCLAALEQQILDKKVKFPLLELCAKELYQTIRKEEHIALCDGIEALKTEGGNVLLGILLQCRLTDYFEQSIDKATEYIARANAWYVCDIIGERVYGYALLHEPEAMLPQLTRLSGHPVNWVVRALGAGVHYATKKGLHKQYIQFVFPLLLTQANAAADKEVKQGVGWAAKTIAKFHPDIIAAFREEIHNSERVAHWFRAKIRIGLNRNAYAQRDNR